jgi:hypothetical protein
MVVEECRSKRFSMNQMRQAWQAGGLKLGELEAGVVDVDVASLTKGSFAPYDVMLRCLSVSSVHRCDDQIIDAEARRQCHVRRGKPTGCSADTADDVYSRTDLHNEVRSDLAEGCFPSR